MKTVISSANRIVYIDIAKGLGILLVILGHLLEAPSTEFEFSLKLMIYSFHMPLFFILSGMTYKPIAGNGIKDTFITSLDRKKYLLLSYVFYSIIYLLRDILCFLFNRIELDNILLDLYKTITFEGINVLWFLSTLLLTEVLFDLVFKIFKQNIVFIGIFEILICIFAIIIYNDISPYIQKRVISIIVKSLFRPIICLLFFYIGFCVKKYAVLELVKKIVKKPALRIPIIIAFMFVALWTSKKNGEVDVHNIILGNNAFLTILLGIVLSLIIISLCTECHSFNMLREGIVFWGKNSLFVMATHNYLGVRTFSEFVSDLIIPKIEIRIYFSFILIIILEMLLIFLFGKKLNKALKALIQGQR